MKSTKIAANLGPLKSMETYEFMKSYEINENRMKSMKIDEISHLLLGQDSVLLRRFVLDQQLVPEKSMKINEVTANWERTDVSSGA